LQTQKLQSTDAAAEKYEVRYLEAQKTINSLKGEGRTLLAPQNITTL
jgi:hypothetical protein